MCMYIYSIVNSGNFQLINGTCEQEETLQPTMKDQSRCPELRNITIECDFSLAYSNFSNSFIYLYIMSNLFYAILFYFF
jgi:hypothetical protein